MTAAVCIKCGCMKIGALTVCPDCGFEPDSEIDKAKALCLCDWSMDWDEIEKFSKHLKAGNPVTFEQDALDQWLEDETVMRSVQPEISAALMERFSEDDDLP